MWKMALRPEKVRIRFSSAIPRLALIVLTDIIRSNIAVGRIIIARGNRHRTSGFILLPLDLRNRYGLAVLGIIITATPGTLWMQYDSARSVRSEEHTSELQSLMRTSYAVFCLTQKTKH